MRQTTLKTVYISFAAGLAAAVFSSNLSAQIRYELVIPEVAGNPVSKTSSFGNEINENGETLLNRITTFAVWKDGAVTHIASAHSSHAGSVSQVSAASINGFQQVVGSKTYPVTTDLGKTNDTFPFYWDPSNGIVDLDDLGSRSESGFGNTRLFGINKAGVSLGTTVEFDANTPAGNTAFIWSFENGRIDIPALSIFDSQSLTTPNAINDSGLVVGTYRQFWGGLNAYTEQGFFFTAAEGSQDLNAFDPGFFNGTHISARDVNNASTLVGEQDDTAFWYNIETRQGQLIAGPNNNALATRAFAISDTNLIAGAQLLDLPNSNSTQLAPFVWSREAGSIDLLPHLENTLAETLPVGLPVAETRITPKSINSQGQISATLQTGSSFSREVVLQPTLAFQWTSMMHSSENGVRGALYRYEKSQNTTLLPASALGYEIAFECSPDMANWKDISHPGSEIRHSETSERIELFVPFTGCLFVRAKLKTLAQ